MDSNPMQGSPAPEGQPTTGYKRLEGLGGWLILVQVSIYLSLISVAIMLFNNVIPAFKPEFWNVLTDPSSPAYDPLWKPMLIFEAVGNSVLLLFLIVMLPLLYGKKRAFPKTMITLMIVSLLLAAVDYAMANQIKFIAEMEGVNTPTEIVRSIIYCCIWIPYFLRSERVRNTFVK